MTKYKYSRKEWFKKVCTLDEYANLSSQSEKDLLATKEVEKECEESKKLMQILKDNIAKSKEKECKHKWVEADENMFVCGGKDLAKGCFYCHKCLKLKPSLLDEIEEISEIDLKAEYETLAKECKILGVTPYLDETGELEKYVNQLIRNQNILIKYLKSK